LTIKLHYFVRPNAVYISPTALSSSEAAVTVRVADEAGQPLAKLDIRAITDKGGLSLDGNQFGVQVIARTDGAGVVTFMFSANWLSVPGVTPGDATIAVLAVDPRTMERAREVITVMVIGPPASITVAAAPSIVRCGERVTITASIRDAIGQPVEDGHHLRLWTNKDGVLAPSDALTYNGVATAWLLTDRAVEGPYEVVATIQSSQHAIPPLSAFITVYARRPAHPQGDVDEPVAESTYTIEPDMPPVMPRGSMAIFFLDISGSTLLQRTLGDQRWSVVRRAHAELMRGSFRRHGAHEIKDTGDGFMVAFQGGRDAVLCAMEMQRVSSSTLVDGSVIVPIHIGIHVGEPIPTDGDLSGQAVTFAQRITEAAKPGEILTSYVVKEAVGAAGDIQFGEPRTVSLKGLEEPHQVFPVIWE
jgi:class 3 adenylate cyclase